MEADEEQALINVRSVKEREPAVKDTRLEGVEHHSGSRGVRNYQGNRSAVQREGEGGPAGTMTHRKQDRSELNEIDITKRVSEGKGLEWAGDNGNSSCARNRNGNSRSTQGGTEGRQKGTKAQRHQERGELTEIVSARLDEAKRGREARLTCPALVPRCDQRGSGKAHMLQQGCVHRSDERQNERQWAGEKGAQVVVKNMDRHTQSTSQADRQLVRWSTNALSVHSGNHASYGGSDLESCTTKKKNGDRSTDDLSPSISAALWKRRQTKLTCTLQ